MSSLFNQTNISPGTPFSGGGSGSNTFPNGIAISANGTDTKFLQIDPNVYWAQPMLAVENTSNTGPAIPQGISANPFFAFSWDGSNANTSKSGSYSATGIYYQGNAGSGTGTQFLNVVDGALNNSPANLAFQMTGLSSIQGGTFIINAEKMCSTIQGYGWA